ncbi:MAG: hypothetical protein DCC65_15330 [Planctomycetota bacterium]|nr:MAG: hypothetical protein DCC65_15330 [Planctomycetota bacterium]
MRQGGSRCCSGDASIRVAAGRFDRGALAVDYTVVIERADDRSYSAYLPDLPGCVSCGDSPGQALDSIREAITGHIQLLRESGEPVSPARSIASVVHAA